MNDQKPLSLDAFMHRKAREAIRTAALPSRPPDRLWGSLGSGAQCCICGLPIGSDQTELELEFLAEDRSRSAYHIVHLGCFSIFEVERQLLATEGPSAGAAAKPGDVGFSAAT